jgi:hypothetical protein
MFAPSRPGDGDAPDAAMAHDDPQAMRQALKHELNRVRDSRYVLRHLAKIEHDLKTQGLDMFDRLPLRVLEKAAAQLESLVEPPFAPGIAALRSRLAVAMLARERIERSSRDNARPPGSEPARSGGSKGDGTAAPPAARRSAANPSSWSSWSSPEHVEVRESSFADFERASTEWQLLDEPPKR